MTVFSSPDLSRNLTLGPFLLPVLCWKFLETHPVCSRLAVFQLSITSITNWSLLRDGITYNFASSVSDPKRIHKALNKLLSATCDSFASLFTGIICKLVGKSIYCIHHPRLLAKIHKSSLNTLPTLLVVLALSWRYLMCGSSSSLPIFVLCWWMRKGPFFQTTLLIGYS